LIAALCAELACLGEWRRSLGGGAIIEASKNALEARRRAKSTPPARKINVGLLGVPEARFFRADSGSPTFPYTSELCVGADIGVSVPAARLTMKVL
jgi:hypothetical protein